MYVYAQRMSKFKAKFEKHIIAKMREAGNIENAFDPDEKITLENCSYEHFENKYNDSFVNVLGDTVCAYMKEECREDRYDAFKSHVSKVFQKILISASIAHFISETIADLMEEHLVDLDSDTDADQITKIFEFLGYPKEYAKINYMEV